MADENRVFDVAKPGSSKPETGSKPMVVGHKMMKDPTLKDTDEDITVEPQKIQQTVGKTIKPPDTDISNKNTTEESDTKGEIETSDVEIDNIKQPVVDTNDKPETDAANNEDTLNQKSNLEPEVTEDNVERKEKSLQENGIELEENLQKIIKEKTYNVHIEEASAQAFKTFIKTFIIVAIVGLIILVVLIDADIIDLGVTLPFDFL